MPLINTKPGCWKYGKSGHEYCGKDAKQKAIKQGLAENDGKWSDATIYDDDTERVISEVLFDHKLDRLNARAIIVVAESPDGSLGYKILGQGEVYATFDEALQAKAAVDAERK